MSSRRPSVRVQMPDSVKGAADDLSSGLDAGIDALRSVDTLFRSGKQAVRGVRAALHDLKSSRPSVAFDLGTATASISLKPKRKKRT